MVSRVRLPSVVNVVAGLRLGFKLESCNGTFHELHLEVVMRVTVGR